VNRDRRAAKAARKARERKTAVDVRWTRCPACHGKRLYATEGDALVVAVRAAWSGTQRAYRCPRSNGWHLTHKPKRGTT